MESAEFIQTILDNLNYFWITVLMAVESSFIPFPSELVVPPAAYMAAIDGKMSVPLVVVFATLGADIGALVNYYLARWLGRPIVYRFAESRLGRMCLIDREKVDRAEAYFDRHGAVSTFVGRLLPAIRQLISIPAGLARMRLAPFLLYTTLGAGLWNGILAAIGYYLSTVPGIDSKEQLQAKINHYSHELGYVLLVVCAAVVVFLVYRGVRKKKSCAKGE